MPLFPPINCAIQNAIGKRIDPPATPDKVLNALGKKAGGKGRDTLFFASGLLFRLDRHVHPIRISLLWVGGASLTFWCEADSRLWISELF